MNKSVSESGGESNTRGQRKYREKNKKAAHKFVLISKLKKAKN